VLPKSSTLFVVLQHLLAFIKTLDEHTLTCLAC